MHRFPLAVAGVALALAACGPAGSGTLVTEVRDVGPFSAISVSAGVEVRLVVDPDAPQSVAVTYDDNLLDRIRTATEGDTLVISPSGSFRTTGGGRFVSVTTPRLTRLAASSGATVIGAGSAASLDLDVSSGGDVDISDVDVAMLTIAVSSGAEADVRATQSVSGDVSSGASVRVFGDPVTRDVSTSSGADVEYVD
jgi:hypothetical protein